MIELTEGDGKVREALRRELENYHRLGGSSPNDWLRAEIQGHIEYIKQDDNTDWYNSPYRSKEECIAEALGAMQGTLDQMLDYITYYLGDEALTRLDYDINQVK